MDALCVQAHTDGYEHATVYDMYEHAVVLPTKKTSDVLTFNILISLIWFILHKLHLLLQHIKN